MYLTGVRLRKGRGYDCSVDGSPIGLFGDDCLPTIVAQFVVVLYHGNHSDETLVARNGRSVGGKLFRLRRQSHTHAVVECVRSVLYARRYRQRKYGQNYGLEICYRFHYLYCFII